MRRLNRLLILISISFLIHFIKLKLELNLVGFKDFLFFVIMFFIIENLVNYIIYKKLDMIDTVSETLFFEDEYDQMKK